MRFLKHKKNSGFTPTPFLKKGVSSRSKRGFTLIEMIVYTTILAAVFVVVINTLLIVSRSYRSIKLSNDINNSSSLSLERLTREIRNAESVSVGTSILDTNPGRLVLNTTESGSPTTLDFYVEDNLLKLKKGGVVSGVLVRDNIEVSNLVFRHIVDTNSEAVKIEMTLTGNEKGTTKIKNFFTSTVLRGSY